MIVYYQMISDGEKYEFKSVGKLKDNVLEFRDTINKNNTVKIIMNYPDLTIIRDGKIKMELPFSHNLRKKGYYINEMNYTMSLETVTNILKIDKNSIFVEYESYLEGKYVSNNEITVRF